jgi:septum formation topological specificity factor MinE
LRAEASVEHLVALTHGGKDNDENCVACCKALNTLFGRISLKEKLRIILNQQGRFACPAAKSGVTTAKTSATPKLASPVPLTADEKLQIVVSDLRKRGDAKPGTVDKLRNTMKTVLRNGVTEADLDMLVQTLESSGAISISGDKVTYALPPGAL